MKILLPQIRTNTMFLHCDLSKRSIFSEDEEEEEKEEAPIDPTESSTVQLSDEDNAAENYPEITPGEIHLPTS